MTTEYLESVDEAAQIARAALPLASKLGLAANPVTYAILYEYVAGQNQELKRVMDELRLRPDGMTMEKMHELYNTYISEATTSVVNDIRGVLGHLITSTQGSLSKARQETEVYESNLGEGVEELNDVSDEMSLVKIASRLIDETARMQITTRTLNNELQQVSTELEDLREECQRVRHESEIDPVTGSKNRRSFDKAIALYCELAIEEQKPLSLLMIDIDHFKRVNDTFGHITGDAVLKWVASVITGVIRGSDILARFGGEEFAVLLPETDLAGAQCVAQNICHKVGSQQLKYGEKGQAIGTVTVSVGLAQFQTDESVEDFINRSDRALYEAKEQGRNRVAAKHHQAAAGA